MERRILETVHGSHLYGMNLPGSDFDFFRVVSGSGRTTHRVNGPMDITEMSLDRFLENVFNGSHQSCEALFSPVAMIDPEYRSWFGSIRVTGSDVFARYRRTIKAFSYGSMKQRRHAVRLGFNLADLRRNGRFSPVMTDDQKLKIGVISQLYWGESLFDIASNF